MNDKMILKRVVILAKIDRIHAGQYLPEKYHAFIKYIGAYLHWLRHHAFAVFRRWRDGRVNTRIKRSL